MITQESIMWVNISSGLYTFLKCNVWLRGEKSVVREQGLVHYMNHLGIVLDANDNDKSRVIALKQEMYKLL